METGTTLTHTHTHTHWHTHRDLVPYLTLGLPNSSVYQIILQVDKLMYTYICMHTATYVCLSVYARMASYTCSQAVITKQKPV